VLWKLWEIVTGYLKDRPWWQAVQPFAIVALAGGIAETLAWQFIRTQYGFSPDLRVFLSSYLSTRILVVTGAVLLLLLLLRVEPSVEASPTSSRVAEFLRRNRRVIAYRGTVVILVAAAAALGVMTRAPARVGHVTVRFMGLPAELRPDALAYVIYELNRPQRQWQFDVDFTPFNPLALTSTERAGCEHDPQPLLCHAERMAEGRGPVIAVTDVPLNGAYFATHRGAASVITTADAGSYAPLTQYEYLAYMIVVQSVLLHLDSTGGLPDATFAPGTASTGDTFQFVPDRDTLKSTILAARVSPAAEELIFNRFGPEYLGVYASLVSLDWLYSSRVRTNLSKVFGVELSR
jgi:hypothetical protein